MLHDPRDCNPLCDGVMCLHHEISWYQKKKITCIFVNDMTWPTLIPMALRVSLIKPLLKNASRAPAVLDNYRLISNVFFLISNSSSHYGVPQDSVQFCLYYTCFTYEVLLEDIIYIFIIMPMIPALHIHESRLHTPISLNCSNAVICAIPLKLERSSLRVMMKN